MPRSGNSRSADTDQDLVASIRAQAQNLVDRDGSEPSTEPPPQVPQLPMNINWKDFFIPRSSSSKKSGKSGKKEKRSKGSSKSSSSSDSAAETTGSSGSSDSSDSDHSRGKSKKASKSKKPKRKRSSTKPEPLPKAANIEFKQKTHQHQYEANEEVYKNLRRASKYLAQRRIGKARRKIQETRESVRKRQKLILTADIHGWQVVNTMASNSNLKCLSKEEAKDLKQALQTSAQPRSRGGGSSRGGRAQGQGSSRLSLREEAHNSILQKGRCDICKKVGHSENDCLQVRAGNSGSSSQANTNGTSKIQ